MLIFLFACELGLCYAGNLCLEEEFFWYQQGQDLPGHPRQEDHSGTGWAPLLWACLALRGSVPSYLSTHIQRWADFPAVLHASEGRDGDISVSGTFPVLSTVPGARTSAPWVIHRMRMCLKFRKFTGENVYLHPWLILNRHWCSPLTESSAGFKMKIN